jgi:hypothetical protein
MTKSRYDTASEYAIFGFGCFTGWAHRFDDNLNDARNER